MPPYNFAIIGAGPAGCVLARLLLKTSAQVTVFEAEKSFDARGQGGTLDLHEDTGLLALRECGLYDDFLKYARFDGEAIKLCDKNMLNYINFGGTKATNSRGRPEIDRQSLRKILLDSLPAHQIRWNHRLRSVTEDPLTLHFDNGVAESGYDLIIGADGAWTKPRSLLTNEEPYYSGIFGNYFRISDCETRFPDIHKYINRGSVFAFSDGRSITAQQLGDKSIWVGCSGVKPADFAEKAVAGYDVNDPKQAKAARLKEYSDWAPLLRKIIEVVDEDYTMGRPLYMLPVGHRWAHRQSVTLIGDAAHLMTPYAGEGVNVAMKDAVNLAKAVRNTQANMETAEALDQEVKAFEEEMFVRAGKVAAQSERAMQFTLFEPGAPRSSIERYIINMAEGDVSWIALLGIKFLVYVFFFFYKLLY